MKAYVTRREARGYVQGRRPFRTSNGQLYGVLHHPCLYVVYSYGAHWPLFVWNGFDWFENEDKHSMTTSHHSGYTHPHVPTELRSLGWLKAYISEHQYNLSRAA
jgi:hypothetical protein